MILNCVDDKHWKLKQENMHTFCCRNIVKAISYYRKHLATMITYILAFNVCSIFSEIIIFKICLLSLKKLLCTEYLRSSIFNLHCNKAFISEKVDQAAPMIDNKPPKTYMHLHLKLKNLQASSQLLFIFKICWVWNK